MVTRYLRFEMRQNSDTIWYLFRRMPMILFQKEPEPTRKAPKI